MSQNTSAQTANLQPHLRHSAFLNAPSDTEPVSFEHEEREPVRLLAIGTASGIDTIIQTLHLRGFAHISEWSPLMPHSSGKFMRVLTRWVQGRP
jgi:hypothetical protein